jgi:hypothetical protein
MTNISAYVYKDGDSFYFDSENYTDNIASSLSIDYEDGDMVKWVWEDKKMTGVLREEGRNLGLFKIQNASLIE